MKEEYDDIEMGSQIVAGENDSLRGEGLYADNQRHGETQDNLSRLTVGHVESIEFTVPDLVTNVAELLPGQADTAKQLFDAVMTANFSEQKALPFPRDVINRIFDATMLSRQNRQEIMRSLEGLHQYYSYEKLQKTDGFKNPNYAISDYKQVIQGVVDNTLEERYSRELVRPVGDAGDVVVANNRRDLLAPLHSGDGIMDILAVGLGISGGVGIQGYAIASVLNVLIHSIFGEQKSFFSLGNVNPSDFFNTAAVSGALITEAIHGKNTRNGHARTITPSGVAMGALVYTALSGRDNQYLINAALAIGTVQLANAVERIPMVNRVLGTAKEGIVSGARYLGRVIEEGQNRWHHNNDRIWGSPER